MTKKSPMKFYFPGGRTADTLAEAIGFGESFIAATADHEYVYFVDWAELDDEDRAPLAEIAATKSDEEAAQQLRDDIDALAEAEREACRRDDLATLLAWTIET